MRQEDGQWKVYDVTVDSISIIANYRNQFNRVINDQGFPALMAAMREKQKHLEATI
jgi:phospholipid transport system substrate-binding protein